MKLATLILLTLTICSCGSGTGTGNPNQAGSGSYAHLISADILDTACQVLKKCHSDVTDLACFNGLQNLSGFAPKLGLVDDSLTSNEILLLEYQGTIVPNSVQGNKCMAQMLKLPCTDAKVRNAYQPASAQPFAKTPEMLDPVCTGVFGNN